MNHRTIAQVRAGFPTKHRTPRPNQVEAFKYIAEHDSLVLEAPTGTGKTDIGVTYLALQKKRGAKHRFYLVPNKALAEQVKALHPSSCIMLGRDEHTCLYYYHEGQNVTARESPCAMLTDCPHRVDQTTGETHTAGVKPCPYLLQKYEAKQGKGDVIATFAFFLYSHFFAKEWEGETAVVIDEADTIADSIRSVLSYEISERMIQRAATVLSSVAPEEARELRDFAATVGEVVSRYPSGKQTLITNEDLIMLIRAVLSINGRNLVKAMSAAVRASKFDATVERDLLRHVNDVAVNLARYASSLGFALDRPEQNRKALSYVCAYWDMTRESDNTFARKLIVRSWYVAALIGKMLPQKKTLAMSATIGDPQVFAGETGITAPVKVLESALPTKNARIYMPIDTPNLAMNNRRGKESRKHKERAIEEIAAGCAYFRKHGMRSLVVVVSDAERRMVLAALQKHGVTVATYGIQPNGSDLKPREIAAQFRKGYGDVLLGTSAQFSKGIDLPKKSAPVVFVLRPAYPNPYSPLTEFQERRLGRRRWALWNHRVMVDALQVRGRNLRGPTDCGVTIFVSQQFQRFVFNSLPKSLRSSYVGDKTLAQCLKAARQFLERD